MADRRPCDDPWVTKLSQDAWPELSGLIAAAPAAQVLEGGSVADRAHLGLTERSYLGALIAHTGGITVDHGWLRLLGGAGGRLPSVLDANTDSSGRCVVGFDVLGGVFALDGGSLGVGDGHVHYFAPDSLRWEGLDLTHSEFLTAMLTDAIGHFYGSLRWDGWAADVAALALDRGFSMYPPLWSAEGKDPNASDRRDVPMTEVARDHWPAGTSERSDGRG